MWKRPERKVIDGNWIIIEPVNYEKHLNDLFDMTQSSESENNIFQYMWFGPFKDKDDFSIWLKKQTEITENNVYSIFSKRLNKYVGMYSIMSIDESNGRAELGCIWYGKPAQRTEINTDTTFTFLKYLFEELKYRRVEWKCNNENIASKNTASRLGFTFEGIFRKHMIVKDKNRDTAWFSIIDDEWDKVKENFTNNLLKKYE